MLSPKHDVNLDQAHPGSTIARWTTEPKQRCYSKTPSHETESKKVTPISLLVRCQRTEP